MIQQSKNTQQTTTELPSLKKTLLQPKILLTIIAIGAVLNLLFISTTIYLSTNRTNTSITSTTTTPTAIPTTKPTQVVLPTKTITEIDACFESCDEENFLNQLEAELKPYTYVKSAISYFNYKNDTCYGEFSQFETPAKEYQSQFLPSNCLPNSEYDSYQITYHIDNVTYYYDKDHQLWEQGTSSTRLQLSFFDVINELKRQQAITSIINDEYRIITGTSKTINAYNQSITSTISVYVDIEFKLISYEILEGDDYAEYGTFFDYGIPNTVEAPE